MRRYLSKNWLLIIAAIFFMHGIPQSAYSNQHNDIIGIKGKYSKNNTTINIKRKKIYYSNEIILKNRRIKKHIVEQNPIKADRYKIREKKSAKNPIKILTHYPKLKKWDDKKIYQILKAYNPDGENEIKQKLIQFYAERQFKPLWGKEKKITKKAEKIIQKLKNAYLHGLNPNEYHIQDGQYNDHLEVKISLYALKYIKHALFGYIKEEKIKSVNEPKWKPLNILKNLAEHTKPDAYMETFHPQHRAYQHMKATLEKNLKYNQTNTQIQNIKIQNGPLLKTGKQDSRVPQIVRKLSYLKLIEKKYYNNIYDQKITKAVISFQKNNNLQPDGIIGQKTLNALNKIKVINPIHKLKINMDRLRKLPHQFNQKYILINLPEFKLHFIEKNKPIYQSQIIVGKPYLKTPIFQNNITRIVFNPFWNVPRSIATNEILPEIKQKGSHILKKRNFHVINQHGEEINPKHINWNKYDKKSFPFRFRQKPGRQNALGKIKIAFPNQHSIYMHDTPEKNLFNKTNRALSHGCIRVKNIQELTSIILNVKKEDIKKTIQTKRNRVKNLSQEIPIYITYFTAWPDRTGKIKYYNDIYQYDENIPKYPLHENQNLQRNVNEKYNKNKIRISQKN